uniref:Uncharacterized protein n=1 Tax=Arundo donax TaxID=35708 RepID=A0A0A9E7J2_ARUDO
MTAMPASPTTEFTALSAVCTQLRTNLPAMPPPWLTKTSSDNFFLGVFGGPVCFYSGKRWWPQARSSLCGRRGDRAGASSAV